MLSRSIEYREGLYGKQPQLADLANSCYIEELGDVIMMVYRPEYYHIYQDEKDRDLHGLMQIIVRKNALLPLDSISLAYEEKTGRVSMPSSPRAAVLESMKKNNDAIGSLIRTFNLE